MRCPECSRDDRVIKCGLRKTGKGSVQKYLCRRCGRYFSSSLHPYSKYPDRVILHALELYDSGRTVEEVSVLLENEYHTEVPDRTIYSWLKRYEREYDLYVLKGHDSRKTGGPVRAVSLPIGGGVSFGFHVEKLRELCDAFPKLRNYLFWVGNDFPVESLSRFSIPLHEEEHADNIVRNRGDIGFTLELAHLRFGEEPGPESIREFFLLVHPGCVAVSLPVFTDPEEGIGSLLGLVDIVMIDRREVRLVVIDPDPSGRVLQHCIIKRKAFMQRTDIPAEMIRCSMITRNGAFDLMEP